MILDPTEEYIWQYSYGEYEIRYKYDKVFGITLDVYSVTKEVLILKASEVILEGL